MLKAKLQIDISNNRPPKEPEMTIIRSSNGFVITATDNANDDPFKRYRDCYVAESVLHLNELIKIIVKEWHEEV